MNHKQISPIRRVIITFSVMLIVVLLIWFGIRPVLHTQASTYLKKSIQEVLAQQQDLVLSFDDMSVNILQGSVTVKNLHGTIVKDGSSFSARALTIRAPLSELTSIAVKREGALSTIEIDILQPIIQNSETSFACDTITIQAEGHVDPFSFESSSMRRCNIQITGSSIAIDSIGSFLIDTVTCYLSGSVLYSSLESGLSSIIEELAYVEAHIGRGKFIPSEGFFAFIAPMTAISSWLSDPSNWSFEELSITSRIVDSFGYVDTFAIQAPLIEATGKAQVSLERFPLSSTVSLAVKSLHPEIHKELFPLLLLFGIQLPTKSFTMDVSTEYSFPQITIR